MPRNPSQFPKHWDHSKGLPPGWSPLDQILGKYTDQDKLAKDYPGILDNGGVYGHVVMTPNGPAIGTPDWMLANARTQAALGHLKKMGDKSPVPKSEQKAQMPAKKERLNAQEMLALAQQASGRAPVASADPLMGLGQAVGGATDSVLAVPAPIVPQMAAAPMPLPPTAGYAGPGVALSQPPMIAEDDVP